ncbi:hypothetical protein M758_2G247900 [Ceratodon purpureus]|nr:hypothetical protein M758_2G247900 [Ceratodon purpureus]
MFVERGWGCGSYASRNVSEVRTRQESKLTKVPPLTVPPLLARDRRRGGTEGPGTLGGRQGGRVDHPACALGSGAAGQRGSGAAGQCGTGHPGSRKEGCHCVSLALSLLLLLLLCLCLCPSRTHLS